jgi:starch synthase
MKKKRKKGLRIAFAAAEYAPLLQTGGLGDAVAGLAGALADRGHELHCLLPGLGPLWSNPLCAGLAPEREEIVCLPDGRERGRWWTGTMGAIHLHLLDVPCLRERQQLYGGPDEGLRFVAFSRAVAARTAALLPHVLVAHDWHAALSIGLLRTLHDVGPKRGIGTVQVVHNAAHIGLQGERERWATGLPAELFQPDGIEFHGAMSLLKGGLVWADRIVAVSPRYAEEIQTPEFGEGLDGLYRSRSQRLLGVANGIDAVRSDPAHDDALAVPFDAKHPGARSASRAALAAELELDVPPHPPQTTRAKGRAKPAPRGLLLGAIGRLAVQKGWDVLADAIPMLVERGACIALVGDGDAALAERLAGLATRFPGRVAFARGWNDALARRVYAGSDAILVPSRFEPCGLVQLLAQRYGALPVAHAVGGLRDTIIDGETGILFTPLSADALVEAVDRASALLGERGSETVAGALLALDVSWRGPAKRWEQILQQVATEAAARL